MLAAIFGKSAAASAAPKVGYECPPPHALQGQESTRREARPADLCPTLSPGAAVFGPPAYFFNSAG